MRKYLWKDHFLLWGAGSPSVSHFSCLIWSLMPDLEDEEELNSSFLFAVNPHNLPDMLLFHFTEVLCRLFWSLVEIEAILGFSQCFSRKGRAQSLFLPLFPHRESAVQFISTYLDLKRKHFSLRWITPDSCKVRPTSKRSLHGPSKGKHDFPGNS